MLVKMPLVSRLFPSQGLTFTVDLYDFEESGIFALRVNFRGPFELDHSDNAQLICMGIGCALCYPRGPGIALLIDFSELDYNGGDDIHQWTAALPRLGLHPATYPVVLLCSPSNAALISSCLEETVDATYYKVFSNEKDALTAFLHWPVS